MGNCGSRERKSSRQIDHELARQRNKVSSVHKILLLGAGESGKTTILKQMKIIHGKGLSKKELVSFKLGIYRNLLESIHSITAAMQQLHIPYSNPECEDISERYSHKLQLAEDPESILTRSDILQELLMLWRDPSIQTLLDCQDQFYLLDSAPYFLDNLERLCHEDYIPTEEDVLRVRMKSTGAREYHFVMENMNIRMFDVGGQRSERRKWIHCFEGVTSVIFVVALSEYDQVLREESSQNRMVESLVLFESIVNSLWFCRSSIILFLNKMDLFKKKIGRSDISKWVRFRKSMQILCMALSTTEQGETQDLSTSDLRHGY